MSIRVSELPEPFQIPDYVPPEPLMREQDGACVWMMRKNCSASPSQVLAFYGSVSALSLAFAVVFAMRGLWMVLPFSLIESLVLGVALLYYAKHALDRECVRLQPGRLSVEVVIADKVMRYEFDAAHARLEWDREHDLVWLCSPNQRLRLGKHLTAGLRRRFAQELGALISQRQKTPAASCSAPRNE